MKKILVLVIFIVTCGCAFAQDGLSYFVRQDTSSGRPVTLHIVYLQPNSNYNLELTYGNNSIDKLLRVENFAKESDACVALNASFFKQDTGTPLGLTIVDGKLMTGPLMKRSAFGVDKQGNCFIDRVALEGNIGIGYNNIPVTNINQPIVSQSGVHLYNYRWGTCTPETSQEILHIVVSRNRIAGIFEKSVQIPEHGYVLVVKKSDIQYPIRVKTPVKYCYSLMPQQFCDAKFAFAGGPNLVVNGQKNVDSAEQGFNIYFVKAITARSAIGIKQDGTVILLAVDGKRKDVSEGVNLSELADIMIELGAYQAMNLDGGSSTQLVINKQMVNIPTNRCGARVTNAVIIKKKDRLFF